MSYTCSLRIVQSHQANMHNMQYTLLHFVDINLNHKMYMQIKNRGLRKYM